jgi:predicted permease
VTSGFLADLRYAARLLRKAPTFSAVAVATLALGIGANAAIFSVVNATLFRPLPYPDADRLVVVAETVQRNSLERRPLSYPDFLDYRARTKSLDAMAAWSGERLTLSSPAAPARPIDGELVSSHYFELLGARTLAGRTFTPAEADERDAHPLAVISHRVADQQFGGDQAAVGQTLTLNDRAFTVVGVLTPDFRGMSDTSEVWIPFGMLTVAEPARFFDARASRWFDAVGKLTHGATLAQARAELAGIGRQIEESEPGSNAHYGGVAYDLKAELVGDLRPLMLTLLGAVGFVLLIACVNLANLLLARASSRERESAIRAALGADRLRLARQFVAEGTLLSVTGAFGGVLIAMWSTDSLMALAPAGLPSFVHPGLDWRVLAFVTGVAAACALLLGLLPAIQGTRTDLNEALKEGARGSSGGPARTRVRAALVTAEVALSVLLLAGAGLMVRSFINLQRIDVGFRADRAATLRIALPQALEPAQLATALDGVLGRVRAVPGVEQAAAGTDAPFSGGSSATIVTAESGDPGNAARGIRVYRHAVTPGFFTTLAMPLAAGRAFAASDAAGALPVAVVSRAFAAKAFGAADPIGKRFAIGRGSDGNWITVIGVVSDVRYRSLRAGAGVPEDPDVYFPFAQQPARAISIVAGTALRPAAILDELRAAVQAHDRDIPVSGERAMSDLIASRTSSFRLGAGVMTFFGGIALLLAGIGVFGLINYSVTERRRELGVRAALGAGRRELYRLVLTDAAVLTAIGLGIGLVAAWPATRLLSSQLYGVTPGDPLTYATIAGLLAGVSVAAALLPAHRAARIDPIVALRAE